MLIDLLQGGLFLLPIGAGVAVLAIVGRDRDDADFTVADYREPEPVDEPAEPAPVEPEPSVEPAAAGTPLYEQLAARPYVPLDDEAVRALADEWLREFGERARAQLQPTA